MHIYSLIRTKLSSGYFSNSCLSMVSNQSACSDLRPLHQRGRCVELSSTHLPLEGYVLFLGPFSVNTRDDCDVKIPIDQQFVKHSDLQPVWQQQPCLPRSKSLQSIFSPADSDAHFEFRQVVFATPSCLNALICRHVIG